MTIRTRAPFEPTHARMAALELRRDTPPHLLAAELRRAFSGIVAGNVKDQGVRLIERHGPFELHGDPELLRPLPGVRDVRVQDTTCGLVASEIHLAIPALLDLLGDRRTKLAFLTTHSATLEDVFMHLTGRHLRDA